MGYKRLFVHDLDTPSFEVYAFNGLFSVLYPLKAVLDRVISL
jgi:hypothetical protein